VLGTSGTLPLDAGLSFLTLGVPPPTPSWGRMIEEATTYFRNAPWLAIFPASRSFTPSSASTSSATASSATAQAAPSEATRPEFCGSIEQARCGTKTTQRNQWMTGRTTS
jgi:hypothetical protein